MFKPKKTALFLFTFGLAIASLAEADSALFDLPVSGLHLLSEASLIQPLDPEMKITFRIWLKLRNQKALAQLVEAVYDPASPRYQQFLTSASYEQNFAPKAETETALKRFFTAQGMDVRLKNHHLAVTGSVEQINQALHLQMQAYHYQGQTVYAPDRLPRLSADLGQAVLSITGLNNIPEFHADLATAAQEGSFVWNTFIPAALPTDTSLQGFSGANLQKTYNISNIPPVNGVPLDGSGQTLVIVDNCGSNGPAQILSDANQYFHANGIKPFILSGPNRNFAIINPDGSPFGTCPNSSFSREVALDVEASHTLAPGNNTVLVLGSSDQRSTLMSVISTLVNNHFTIAGFSNAYVISNSWSSPESSIDPALESLLQLAAASGISVNFSSGDCGDNTYSTASKCNAGPLAVNYPSSSAYVTAVGATALFVDNKYRYAFETVWGTVKTVHHALAYDGGTGGGISQFYGPVNWQGSIGSFTAGGYGLISNFGNRRALPDIAMLGAPETGLLIIADGVQVQDGGTSLACPLFSATLVLVNQARSLLNKGSPIGQAAPYLYQMNSVLLSNRALNLIVPPAVMINGSTPPPAVPIQGTPAPASSFSLNDITFGWDSSLTVEPENQFWNDAVGVGSPNIPNFVQVMGNM